MNKIIIIGGGASGLMAACKAAENANNKITVIERQSRPGKKLSATGNGRCNITNTNAKTSDYFGANPGFVRSVMEKYPPERVIEYFQNNLGIALTEEYGGRVYPVSDSALSVVDVLRLTAEGRGVNILTSCEATKITKEKNGYTLSYKDSEGNNRSLFGNKLVAACGGCAGKRVGGTDLGYKLLEPLGHTVTPLYPSLTRLISDSPFPKSLKGIKVNCTVKLCNRNDVITGSEGDLLFTDKGISGTSVFAMSSYYHRAAKKLPIYVSIDFLPAMTKNRVLNIIEIHKENFGELPSSEVFVGLLQNRLGRMAVKYAGVDMNKPMRELSAGETEKLAVAAKKFLMNITGADGFDDAQVTAGGIDTRDVNPKTLESLICPGLYISGELLDVDAPCGGYNLQWAWACGLTIGEGFN